MYLYGVLEWGEYMGKRLNRLTVQYNLKMLLGKASKISCAWTMHLIKINHMFPYEARMQFDNKQKKTSLVSEEKHGINSSLLNKDQK